jgi:hypothetical protein
VHWRGAVRHEAERPARGAVSSTAVWWREPPTSMEERHYSWVGDHLARLEGKEARGEYYARL